MSLLAACGPWLVFLVLAAVPSGARPAGPRGVLLEQLTWQQAEKLLTPDTVVVIPLGAQAKEHGPHLPLANDWNMAEYLKQRVLQDANVVIAPTVNYSFYPAFVEYPGSTSLRLETARDMIVDICRGLARFGPRRFYVLNTGVSTLRALQPAAELLAADGILLHYTHLLQATAAVEKEVARQEGGTHADEIETSIMLYIAPKTVDMSKAVKDYHPGKGPLTRTPKDAGVYSASGVFGDATLATRAKGQRVVETLVSTLLSDIETLRRAPMAAAGATDGGVPSGPPPDGGMPSSKP
ncbi:Creatinine amidohydrolase [Hyalangium minutum]|uniref:Creatinine amidohydrolase n=1 Tax=Hyalangium minutum TaxID=394096 RepID=A0A085W3H0_9BACT|nr:Creatinine amidohydrolase [Hyalangium minutum]